MTATRNLSRWLAAALLVLAALLAFPLSAYAADGGGGAPAPDPETPAPFNDDDLKAFYPIVRELGLYDTAPGDWPFVTWEAMYTENGYEQRVTSFTYEHDCSGASLMVCATSLDLSACDQLKSYTIKSDCLKKIKLKNAYGNGLKDCKGLQSVTLVSADETMIEDYAFKGCTSLTQLDLVNSNVTVIMLGAFMECTSLETVYLPASVENVADKAFYGCSNLKNVLIQDKPTIESGAFDGCHEDLTFYVKRDKWAGDESQLPGKAEFKNALLVKTLPSRIYHVGEYFDVNGLECYLFDQALDGVEVISSDELTARHLFRTVGIEHVEVKYQDLTLSLPIHVADGAGKGPNHLTFWPSAGAANPIRTESNHPYMNNMDFTWWVKPAHDVSSISMTFSEDTAFEPNYDFLCIYDTNRDLVGQYTGTQLAGKTITVQGGDLYIRLYSDYSGAMYGFKVDSYSFDGGAPTSEWGTEPNPTLPQSPAPGPDPGTNPEPDPEPGPEPGEEVVPGPAPVTPAKVTLSSVTPGTKSFTAKWAKASHATSYQLRYSTSSKMTSAKTVTLGKVTSKSVTGLSMNKRYYVQVRGVAEGNGPTKYGAWSTAKSVVTKPVAPSKGAISSLTPGSKRIAVKWSQRTGATSYQVRYSTSSTMAKAKTVTASAKATSKTITKLKGKKRYYVQVCAVKKTSYGALYGAWSTAKRATTKA
ncbi:MAG: leucine-rich repeat protein [Coriobacteriia bacterium]|nr:leucine-rich repeat protein [Coriobacteriia bacterium]